MDTDDAMSATTSRSSSVAGRQAPAPEVFVAYAESDREWVWGFLVPGLGLPDSALVTKERFAPGGPLVTELERAVGQVGVVVLVISNAFLADEWSLFGEALASSAELAGQGGPVVVPLLLERCTLPLRIDAKVSLDCRSPDRWEPELGRLRAMLSATTPATEEAVCPYPGLAAFGREQHHLFFGRAGELQALATRARHQPLIVILGPSGCGKSSLALAGLAPRLQDAEDTRWQVLVVRPGAAPFDALCGAVGAAPGSEPHELPALVDCFLARHPGSERLLLVVDHVEAVFTQAPAGQRDAFLAAVSALRTAPRSCLLLLLRADFFGDLMGTRLWPLGASERLELASLSTSGLRQAIVGPAATRGVHVEPVLVERLVHDCAEEPGALPLLQETLVLLWARRSRRLLTLASYQGIEGVDGSLIATAMVLHADAALGSLSSRQQLVAARVLLRLVQLGEGRAHTRRQQPLEALRRAGPDPVEVDRVIQHLAERRILTLGRPADGGRAEATLAHESLIVRWPTLARWIEEHRSDEVRRRHLEYDAQAWLDDGRDRAALYRGHRLTEAVAWNRDHPGELTDAGLGFVTAGRRRRAAVAGAVAVITTAVMASLLVLAVPAYNRYRQEADAREEQHRLQSQARALGPQVLVRGGRLPPFAGAGAVTVLDLRVDRHEVSNAEYTLCVSAQRCDLPVADPGGPRLPVVNVTAMAARAYCGWIGRRLPTAPEWLWAAVGASGGPYPWGRERPGRQHAHLAFAGHSPERAVMVMNPAFKRGWTPEGIGDLVGNVAEWTATVGHFGPDDRVVVDSAWDGADIDVMLVRMGAGFDYPPEVPARSGNTAHASEPDETTGFRCVAAAD